MSLIVVSAGVCACKSEHLMAKSKSTIALSRFAVRVGVLRRLVLLGCSENSNFRILKHCLITTSPLLRQNHARAPGQCRQLLRDRVQHPAQRDARKSTDVRVQIRIAFAEYDSANLLSAKREKILSALDKFNGKFTSFGIGWRR